MGTIKFATLASKFSIDHGQTTSVHWCLEEDDLGFSSSTATRNENELSTPLVSSVPSNSHEAGKNIEVDILVVGAGAAGMTAALICALEGLEVLLIDRSDQIGGTSATSAGTIWVPGIKQGQTSGIEDDSSNVRRYLDAVIGPAADDRRDAFLASGPEMVEYLARRSDVKFIFYPRHPDYLFNYPGSTVAGRALMPVPFDGRLLGDDFKLVRAPIGEFLALGGMMIGRDDIDPLVRPLNRSQIFVTFLVCFGDTAATACDTHVARDF